MPDAYRDPRMSSTPLRPFARSRVWAPTATEAAAFDRAAIESQGVSQAALMESAGRSAAEILVRLFPQGEVLALIGAGNNGGDGLVMLRTLHAWGRPVRAVLVADREQIGPFDVAYADFTELIYADGRKKAYLIPIVDHCSRRY